MLNKSLALNKETMIYDNRDEAKRMLVDACRTLDFSCTK